MSESPELEPVELGEELFQDAHDVYRRLRGLRPAQPAVLPNGWPGWLVTSYNDARRLLADPRASKDINGARKLFPPGNARGYALPITERACSPSTRPTIQGSVGW